MSIAFGRIHDLPARAEAEAQERSPGRYPKAEGYLLAFLSLCVSLFIGYEMVFRFHVIQSGAFNRSVDGLYIVWGGHFHLAAMSFYWSPLVSLLSVPFALARGLWPPLVTLQFTGNILSAVFASVGVFHLNRILWRFGLSRIPRILWTALYFANPLILIFSSNGMVDGAEGAFIVASLDGVAEFFQSRRLAPLIRGASWLAAAFMLRYESVPIGAAITLAIAVVFWRQERNLQKGIAHALIYVFPVFSAGIIWLLLNWMIKKNPLWFVVSKYSNAAQIASGGYNFPQVVMAEKNIGNVLYQLVHFTDNFWPFLILLGAAVLLEFRSRPNPIGLPIVLGSLGAPALQAILLYKHSSADWVRFFIYYIPFGFLLGGYLISYLRGQAARTAVAVLASAVILSADYVTWNALHSSVWGNGSTGYLAAVGQKIDTQAVVDGKRVNYNPIFTNMWADIAQWRSEADYINARPGLKVLVSVNIMAWIHHSNQIVFTNQPNFESVLMNPRGQVNAILVPPVGVLSQDVDPIDRQYPTMWSGGVPWTKLVHQFPDGSRLYKVLPSAP